MPNRILRTGILASERVNALSAEAEVFYRRLMSVVDDQGRYSADWRLLRSALFPIRVDTIGREQIEAWLGECAVLVGTETEPLVTIYSHLNKKYLVVNNFCQRERTPSRYPSPNAVYADDDKIREREQKSLPFDRNVHADDTSSLLARSNSHSHTPPNTHTNKSAANGSGPRANSEQKLRSAFDSLVAAYPEAGRGTIEEAWAEFRNLCADDESSIEPLCSVIAAGIEAFEQADYRWQSGRIHLLKNFLHHTMWREKPLTKASSKKESNTKSYQQALADGDVSNLSEYKKKYPKS